VNSKLCAVIAVCSSLLVPCAARAEVSDTLACRIGHPLCVKLVIADMSWRFHHLARRCDHDAIFSLLYLRTTQTFQETAYTLGYADLPSVVREDSVFASYYFRAFDAYHSGRGSVPAAWQIAFAAAKQHAVSSVGNALLGMNAHIQRDLPFVLFELDRAGHPVSYSDHNLVNRFLARVDVTEEVRARFDPAFDSGDPAVVQQIIVAWREQAFVNYQRLRSAQTAEARAEVAASIETAAATAGALFAQQLAAPDSSARDMLCAAARREW
jgi:hypothetical protein